MVRAAGTSTVVLLLGLTSLVRLAARVRRIDIFLSMTRRNANAAQWHLAAVHRAPRSSRVTTPFAFPTGASEPRRCTGRSPSRYISLYLDVPRAVSALSAPLRLLSSPRAPK